MAFPSRLGREMLNRLETWLAGALRSALPKTVTTFAGPLLAPAVADVPLVSVVATRLKPRRERSAGEDDTPATIQLTQALTLHGDGQRCQFTLAPGTAQRIIEIEIAAGRLAHRGDDYRLIVPKPTPDVPPPDELLTFYRPPVSDFTLLLRSATRARGCRQRSPCRATLEISTWAQQIGESDELLTPAVAIVLAVFTEIDRVRVAACENPGFTLHLRNPRVDLRCLEHAQIASDPALFRSTARLSLRGEWDLTLALDESPAEDRIAKTIPSVQLLRDAE